MKRLRPEFLGFDSIEVVRVPAPDGPAVPNDRHIPSHMTKVPPLGNGAAEASQARSSVSSNPPASADRSERFLNRLDRELVGLDRVQRNAFLRRQIENWEARYSRFIRSEGKSRILRRSEASDRCGRLRLHARRLAQALELGGLR